MAVQAFLVIPQGAGNPQILDTQPADSYFSSNFQGAAVFEVAEYDFSAENPTTIGSAAGGAGAGKEKLNALVIKKAVDKASPFLFSASASGAHFVAAQLYIRRGGAPGGVPFLGYEFQMVYVTKIGWSGGDGDDDATETVTFVYGALAMALQPANPDGSLAPTAVRGGWSQITNAGNVKDNLILK